MSDSPLRRLLRELKRRKVFRVAGVYAVVAWMITEVVSTVAPLLHLPEWTPTLVLVLLLVGFPMALVIAWAFELTPEGVKRTESAPPAAADGRSRAPAYVGLGILVGLVGFGAYAQLDGPAESVAPAERSIAVLPFHNLSDSRENEYFSDGITEDILTHLSTIGDLRVISRTSVMTYKGSDKTVPEIARELGVAAVLEGSVRRANGRVRVTAQLIRAEDDAHLWARNYDRELTDVFWIQSEIAREIAAALSAELSDEERARIERRATESLDAYDQYLKGREAFFRLNAPDDLKRAIEHFREAVRFDPGFALAHAGMADAFAVLEGYHDLGQEWLDSALVAGTRATLLDPNVAEAYTAQSHAYWLKGHHDLALDLNRRALELKPSYAYAYWNMAMVHWSVGRPAEALRAATRGRALDPNSAWMAAILGTAYSDLHADAEAERWYRRALELHPDFEWARNGLIDLYTDRREFAKAEAQIREARSRDPDGHSWSERWLSLSRGDLTAAERLFEEALEAPERQRSIALALVHIYRKRGQDDRAEALLRWAPDWKKELRESPDGAFPSYTAVYLAQIAAAEEDNDEALRQLRGAVEAGLRNPRGHLATHPLFEGLRTDPRFHELLREAEDIVEAERVRAKEAGLL